MEEINVTQNGILNYLNCEDNQLNVLDLSFNPMLEQLICAENELKSLDLHSNLMLRGLNCADNELRCLNVKNGNNTNFMYFYDSSNEDLLCVEVDDESFANANWLMHVDPITTFNFNCSGPCTTTGINDISLELNVYPNPTNDELTIDLGDYNGFVLVKVFDFSGRLLFTETSRTISLSDLTKGSYLVQVTYGNHHKMIQVIKE